MFALAWGAEAWFDLSLGRVASFPSSSGLTLLSGAYKGTLGRCAPCKMKYTVFGSFSELACNYALSYAATSA